MSIVAVMLSIGLAAFLLQQQSKEPSPISASPLSTGTNENKGNPDGPQIAYEDNAEKQRNSVKRVHATSSATILTAPEAVIRDPDSISDLFRFAAEASDRKAAVLYDQMFTAGSVCLSYLDMPHDVEDPLRKKALEKLGQFCDMEADAIEKSYEKFESTGYFEAMDAVTEDMEFNDVNAAIDTIRHYIAQANRYGAIVMAAAWLVELEYQAEPRPGIIDTEGITWEQAQLAASDAVVVYYCQRLGGCDRNHFFTLSFCAEEGCEEFITDIEQAVFRTRSPRHRELVENLLAFFYSS